MEVMDIVITLILVLILRVYTYINTHQIMYFKYVQFLIWQLYTSIKLLKTKGKEKENMGQTPGLISSTD